jgi:diaminopimelate epimerase
MAAMKIRFTKMHGAGNDFVVLDETRGSLGLSAAHYRALGDRHFGVGADQILSVRPSPAPGIDFAYAIHNADGAEVEQCGNGARCFARYVRDKGLSTQPVLRVQTQKALIELRIGTDGQVTVDMGAPGFDPADLPFDAAGLQPQPRGNWQAWPLDAGAATVWVGAVSMGNPHAVQLVDDVDTAPVEVQGPLIEHHTSFPKRVNAGFMQIVSRDHIRLRVFERGAGETLACGTGACAAVVAGIRLGLLDPVVDGDARGGRLTIEWQGARDGLSSHVFMTGPAQTVFQGEIEL